MPTIGSVGNGYYNYYHKKGRLETEGGKAKEVWYNRDLSSEEICSNNKNVPNRESQYADLYRKLADAYADIAVSNRARYKTADELETAIYAKYFSRDSAYSSYSDTEKRAMYANELNMTEYGCIRSERINIPDMLKDPHLNGEVTANSPTNTSAFNEKMLGAQIGNVLQNNGIDVSLFGGAEFMFAINGMTKKVSVSLLGTDSKSALDANMMKQITDALNTGDNGRNLFYNLLYDVSRQSTLPKDQLAKWSLWSNFDKITGLDIRDFTQTEDGFVAKNGQSARDIFKEALKTTKHVPAEFKGMAYDYFCEQEKTALQYNMRATPDMTLAMRYQNGQAILSTAPQKSIDTAA